MMTQRAWMIAAAVVVAVAALAAPAEACAFPTQGCWASACSRLSVTNFDDLLNAASTNGTLPATQTFNPDDESSKGDWASKAFRNTLGYFFNVYNPLYNGGEYDADKGAVKDKAPFINYLRFRNSFGSKLDTGILLSECCDLCRTTAGCTYYQFNPYVEDIEDAAGNSVGQKFLDGSGDCYKVDEESTLLSQVVKVCESVKTANFFNTSNKATFFGGACDTTGDNDPHFVGAHGTRFDFNGQLDRAFCLITDERLQVNTLLRGYLDPVGGETAMRSWMKELGFVWVASDGLRHTLQLVARNGKAQERGSGFLAQVLLDGSPVAVPSEVGSGVSGPDMQLVYQGMRRKGPYEMDHFSLKIAGLLDLDISMRVAHAKLQAVDDAEVHFNLKVNLLSTSDSVHGVLGQTYRKTHSQQLKAIKYSILSRILGAPVQADGKTGKGFLEGDTSDYITSSVVATDCRFSAMAT